MKIWGIGGEWGPGDDEVWMLAREMGCWSGNAYLLGLNKDTVQDVPVGARHCP